MPPSANIPIPPSMLPPPRHSRFSVKALLSIAVCAIVLGIATFVFTSGAYMPFFSSDIREGVYTLQGVSPGATDLTPQYFGTVTIVKSSDVYLLYWQIGNQTQEGIGIAKNGILSVSYTDTTAGTFNDAGVVSYQVTMNGLQGEWSSMYGSGAVGRETLVWEASILQNPLDTASGSGGAAEMQDIVDALEHEAGRDPSNTSPNPYGNVYVEEGGKATNVYLEQ